MIDRATIDEAKRRTRLSGLIGKTLRLKRAGADFKAICPFHVEKRASFTISDAKGFYHCFGCGAHGDAVQWLIDGEGYRPGAAMAELANRAGLGISSPGQGGKRREAVQLARDSDPEFVESIEVARWIWRSGLEPLRGSPGENWLRARGVHPGPESRVLEQLRWCEAAPSGAWRIGTSPARFLPAMVAPIAEPVVDECAFQVIGLHVTYLGDGGRTKIGRKMFGRTRGAVLLGDWGSRDPGAAIGEGPLAVGEGIETALDFMAQTRTRRGAAMLTLGNLQGVEDRPGGALDLWNVQARKAAVCWAGEACVLVGIDADMKPMKTKLRERRRGPIVTRDLSAIERMQICGNLAAQAWGRTGAAVEVLRPAMGADFNDRLIEA
jgi:hypothetical protein